MKDTRLLMGMPITVAVVDRLVAKKDIEAVFGYFTSVDTKFSTYKKDSEISKINSGLVALTSASPDMQEIFRLAEITKQETNGYFDILRNGKYDPSGLVKGWAIQNAAHLLEKKGFKNFFIEAGGDMQLSGKNKNGKLWRVGIKNPFKQSENVKIVALSDMGIATSGSYIRANHIYSPKNNSSISDIVSLTVIAKNIYDADRMATAAFAMGMNGIYFIDSLKGYEGYMIDKNGIGTQTTGFGKFQIKFR